MKRRAGLAVASMILAACNGIPPNPTAPATPAAAPVPVRAIFITAGPAELPIGGGSAEVTIFTAGSESGTVSAHHVPVQLSATAGTLSATEVITNDVGYAHVTWTSDRTGEIVARSGNVVGRVTVRVHTPQELPPPSPPIPFPQPTPTPPPPAPQPIPSLAVAVSADKPVIGIGVDITFTVQVTGLQAGETVSYYEWDFDGDGTFDATTAIAARVHQYATHGPRTVRVKVTTNMGRSATGTAQVAITN